MNLRLTHSSHHHHHHHHHHPPSPHPFMAANNPAEASSDDFLDQILGYPPYAGGPVGTDPNLALGNEAAPQPPMMIQLSSGDGPSHLGSLGVGLRVGVGLGVGSGGGFHGGNFPLGLSLERGNGGFEASGGGRRFRNDVMDGRASVSSIRPTFHGQPLPNSVPMAPHSPGMRPRVRAKRGQATDPHSIAERLRRERIAERIRALQELVPSVNKTDRAAMLDEIVDYVKFLRLQVKVLSMSRLGGAGAVAPLVTDMPMSSSKEDGGEGGRAQPAWDKWSSDGTERQVAKLMEENVGAAMQFLQSKALCIMPVSLATAIYHTHPPDASSLVKPETNSPP